MLYGIVKWITRLTLKSYFRRIEVKGKHHVPANGAVIFVSNHPSAFMDPMVVASCINRSIHFLVAAEFFGKGLKSWFYQNSLHMIPVYRPTTLPTEAHKNEMVFSKCFELLSKGGALLVFPEGNSITERRIRKLKTGVARMALGTKEINKGKVRVAVIPVGLNYANPHRFRSDLFVNIGNPISTDHFSTEKSEVILLTEKIEAGLKETVLHVQKEELDSVVKKIELILRRKFQKEINTSVAQREQEFAFRQKIIKSIQEISEKQPQQIASLELKLDGYLNKIRKLGISDGSIADLSVIFSVWELFRLIICLPVFLLGYGINSVPYFATVSYFRKLNLFERGSHLPSPNKINQAFKGSVAMAIGMVFFIVWYLALASLCIWITLKVWVGIGLLFLAYFSGLFAMEYIRWIYLFNQKWKLRKLLHEKRDEFASLFIERQEIINELLKVASSSGGLVR